MAARAVAQRALHLLERRGLGLRHALELDAQLLQPQVLLLQRLRPLLARRSFELAQRRIGGVEPLDGRGVVESRRRRLLPRLSQRLHLSAGLLAGPALREPLRVGAKPEGLLPDLALPHGGPVAAQRRCTAGLEPLVPPIGVRRLRQRRQRRPGCAGVLDARRHLVAGSGVDLLAERLAGCGGFGVRLPGARPLGVRRQVLRNRLLGPQPGRFESGREALVDAVERAPGARDLRQRRVALLQSVGRQRFEAFAQRRRGQRPPGLALDRGVDSRRRGLDGFSPGLHRARQVSGPLRGGPVLGAIGHLVEHVAHRQPGDGRERNVLELRADRHDRDFRLRRHPPKRLEANRRQRRLPCHGRSGDVVAQPVQSRAGHGLVRSGPGHRDEVLRFGQPRQRRQALPLLGCLERPGRQVDQQRHGLFPHAFVRVRPANRRDRRRINHLPEGRNPDSRVPILSGDGHQRVLLVERQFLNSGGTNGRAAVLPSGLGAKPVEKSHDVSSSRMQSRMV